MKNLREYISEASNLKPQYSLQDWEKFIKKYCTESGNYSQLAGLDTGAFADYMRNGGYSVEEAAEEWSQDFHVKDDEYNIVVDILEFMDVYYDYSLYGYRDDLEEIIDTKQAIEKDRNPIDWVVEEEDYCRIFYANSKPSGTSLKYAQLLAKYGNRAMLPSNYNDRY